MTAVLGISCHYHDAAAALVRDGCIVAAAQEERFTRIKGDPSFPANAVAYCLEEADMTAGELDAVVLYDQPALTFDRLVKSYLSVAPRGLASWLWAMPRQLGGKLNIRRTVRKTLAYDGPIHFTPHHLAHAASAYYPSPFDEAAVLTIDGVGEWATSTIGWGRDNELRLIAEMRYPDSLGLLYSAFTHFCGFKVNFGEYKLMGLAPYGRPQYLDLIKNKLAHIRDDGTVALNLEHFGFLDTLEMTGPGFERLFGGPRRMPESPITRREMDLAASIQAFTEEVVLKMARVAHQKTGLKKLCLAGGVALNCVANGRLFREGPFEDIWVQPAAGDAGGALGAALAAVHGLYGHDRLKSNGLDRQEGSYLGPGFSRPEIEAFLIGERYSYRYLEEGQRAETVARALADGKIVGFFSGRMEYGPRALGARSILGDARREDTQRIMNLKIKYRESFRPFAPSVLYERVADYFEWQRPGPYMLFTAPVKKERRSPRSHEFPIGDDLMAAAGEKRSDIPAVTHWNYSARLQTVHLETHPLYHDVLRRFEDLTGCGVIVNTSFNVRGEPIVCTPSDAYRCFMRTEIDHLYLDGFWLDKKEQPPWMEGRDWRNDFDLD